MNLVHIHVRVAATHATVAIDFSASCGADGRLLDRLTEIQSADGPKIVRCCVAGRRGNHGGRYDGAGRATEDSCAAQNGCSFRNSKNGPNEPK